MINSEIAIQAIKKAHKSICKYRVSAIGLDKNFRVIAKTFNRPRFAREGGSRHAEMIVMLNRRVKYIIICRITASGIIKPIHPCIACASKAKELGIKIYGLLEII